MSVRAASGRSCLCVEVWLLWGLLLSAHIHVQLQGPPSSFGWRTSLLLATGPETVVQHRERVYSNISLQNYVWLWKQMQFVDCGHA